MRINKIEFGNFRNFEYEVFEFPSLFTVVIGENGKGKSSILQGLRVAAATFLLGIDEAERYHIQKNDVRRIDVGNRFVPQQNCFFVATGSVTSNEVRWERCRGREGGRTDTKNAKDLIDLAQQLNDKINLKLEKEVSMPVIRYFSTARLAGESKQTLKLKKKGSKLKDGYARSIDGNDKQSPFEWIKSGYWKKLKDKPESVLLDAVLEAIDICIPNWTPTEWDEDSDDLGGIYTHDDGLQTFVPLFYLSDGLRTMASMVAEIAYRCAVLNEHLGRNAVKESEGVVLIDELDMHLHPTWQRQVVQDLRTAFPKIQFIVTTHSPFIVQSLDTNMLINLDRVVDGRINDLTINEVAEDIMGVDSIHSEANAKDEELSTQYLTLLAQKGKGVKPDELTLNEIETQVKDPAVRAFLKMNRLK
jgi:predicted ATP-binding protein involved in virulence